MMRFVHRLTIQEKTNKAEIGAKAAKRSSEPQAKMTSGTNIEGLVPVLMGPGRYAVITSDAMLPDVTAALDAAFPEQRGRLGSSARIALTTYAGARLECDYCEVAPNHYEAIVQVGEPEPVDDGNIDF